MTLKIDELRSRLNAEEPDYQALAQRLTAEDVPSLLALTKVDDVMLASKAAYALTLTHDPAALPALNDVASSAHTVVRVAAAGGLRNLGGLDIAPVAQRLLADKDMGVRVSAIKSIDILKLANVPALGPALDKIAAKDADPSVRALAQKALGQTSGDGT